MQPGGNVLRLKGYTAISPNAILGWGGAGMADHLVERKLAAIFAADIAGYSRLMARDEVGTLARLKACRVIIDELIASYRGHR